MKNLEVLIDKVLKKNIDIQGVKKSIDEIKAVLESKYQSDLQYNLTHMPQSLEFINRVEYKSKPDKAKNFEHIFQCTLKKRQTAYSINLMEALVKKDYDHSFILDNADLFAVFDQNSHGNIYDVCVEFNNSELIKKAQEKGIPYNKEAGAQWAY